MNFARTCNLLNCYKLRTVHISSAMTGKFFREQDLETMTKEELVTKVLHFQSLYRQVLKQNEEIPTKLNKMLGKFKGKKNKREVNINFKECKYRRISLKIAYLGWDFDGLQENENTDTIERLLREALRCTKLAAEDDPLKFSRSGRTDKGVSAFQQVITARIRTRLNSGPGVTDWVDPSTLGTDDRQNSSFLSDLSVERDTSTSALLIPESKDGNQPSEIENSNVEITSPKLESSVMSNINMLDNAKASEIKNIDAEISQRQPEGPKEENVSEFDYVLVLNRMLPVEIRVLGWTPVEDENFSARHNCKGREYRYFFPRGKLDIEKMQVGATLLCGLHDFRNFGKVKLDNSQCYIRRIDEFSVETPDGSVDSPDPYALCFTKIKGSGFVYHQVRNMMSILFMIGLGLEQPSIVEELLDIQKNKAKPAYGLVDGYPLVLYSTTYDDMKWIISESASIHLFDHIHKYWRDLAMKVTLSRELIHSIENDQTVIMEKDGTRQHDKFITNFHGVHSGFLKDGVKLKGKRYKRVLDRPKGKTMEQMVVKHEQKRQRLNLIDNAMTD